MVADQIAVGVVICAVCGQTGAVEEGWRRFLNLCQGSGRVRYVCPAHFPSLLDAGGLRDIWEQVRLRPFTEGEN